MALSTFIASFPRQKLSKREKNDKWIKECIDSGLKIVGIGDSGRRTSRKDKLRNYKLYNGKFDKEDMEFELKPISNKSLSFPAEPQYRDVVSPIFNLLFGEEYKRGTNFIVRGTMDDIHSSKEKAKKDAVLKLLEMESSDGNETKKVSEEIEKYYSYSFEDMRESVATKVLKYLYNQLNLEKEFQISWEDSLIAGEEIFSIDNISNEPVAKRENPLEISYLLPPNSFILDDAEIIVKETYKPIGKIIDDFYEDLTPSQIDELENLKNDFTAFRSGAFTVPEKDYIKTEEDLGVNSSNSGFLDGEGNIIVSTVVWKSRKKIGFRLFMDEFGSQQEDVVSEDYKRDKEDPDESVEWKWINEYWEGTKIGEDIYIKMGPKKLQFRRMDNISACKSGFVGTIYNANNSKSTSLMDRLVPWIYLYVTLWYRTELLIAANQGKIALIDLALIPDGWDVEKWLYYATVMKFGFVNSFNEGKKGQATGKLAGSISTQNKSLDLETGNAIQGHIGLLEYVEDKLLDLSGVTKQRKGAVSEREAVGNVERTIVQSSHITEKWFQIHNWTKQRVLETLIEVAKDVWSEGTKKLQYITDDMATVLFTVDGNEFVNSEFGIFVTNASKDQQALQALKQLTQAALQNDKIAFSDVVDLYLSDSVSDIKNKLVRSEKERSEAISQATGKELQAKAEEKKAEIDLEVEKLNREDLNKELDRITDKEIAIIGAESRLYNADSDKDSIPDKLENDFQREEKREKLALEREKERNKKNLEDKKLALSQETQRTNARLKEKEIAIKGRNDKNTKKK